MISQISEPLRLELKSTLLGTPMNAIQHRTKQKIFKACRLHRVPRVPATGARFLPSTVLERSRTVHRRLSWDSEIWHTGMGKRFAKNPPGYFAGLDFIMDKKRFVIPRSATAKCYAKMRRVCFHLRARRIRSPTRAAKSILEQPSTSAQEMFKKLWHYLFSEWDAYVAAELYRGLVIQTLRHTLGRKRACIVMDEKDPNTHDCKMAQQAKKELNIHPSELPGCSPELMPLD